MNKTRAEVNKFYHGPVDVGTANSADYVVAHAKRQASRGKKPSVSYFGISNPKLALETAQLDILARELWDDFPQPDMGRVAIKHCKDEKRSSAELQDYWENLGNLSGLVGIVYVTSDTPHEPLSHRALFPNGNGTIDIDRPAA